MTVRAKATIREFGDYQTPLAFARLVCTKLKDAYKLSPAVILEPTFGAGNFIEGALVEFENIQTAYGVEVNNGYYEATKKRLCGLGFSHKLDLYKGDIFSFDFSRFKERISKKQNLLIIGNPPWATNSQLSAINSQNLPIKGNFKEHKGIDAITGKGNFDIAEYIILRLLGEFSGYNCTLAMLCKTIVAKNIIRDIDKYNFGIAKADMFLFNANDVFGVSCDAALFVAKLGLDTSASVACNVYDFYTNVKERQFGWANGAFYANALMSGITASIDGHCPFEWRQGIKHDCSKVMELNKSDEDKFINGFGDELDLPVGQFVFPLVKSSDIKTDEITKTRKHVVVTQKRVNSDTSIIMQKERAVWEYLTRFEGLLNARRSVIYKKSPKFSVFGVGDYSFSKYKVGISGFYKEPKFALITGEIPIMLDDTCYFLNFHKIEDAIITVALLNSERCKQFLKSVAFLDSKRPYTKEVLKRIDILKLSESVSYEYVLEYALGMKGCYNISERQYYDYLNSCKGFPCVASKQN
ncbi:MAG: hypothetical protein FWG87_02195 [Defluviitaleaceae bacterium]|nr:hypothetical protein [Defluviitaleaceae bacterium]